MLHEHFSKGTSGVVHLDISNLNVASLNSAKCLQGIGRAYTLYIFQARYPGYVPALDIIDCAWYWLPFWDLHFIHLL